MGIALLLCAGFVWAADQDRGRLRDGGGDGLPNQQRLQDGSCQDATAVAPVEPKGDADRLRDGTGDGVPDKVRLQDPARDGSCLA